jgi:hypothetical protein
MRWCERWRAHVVAVERAALRWERQFDPGFPPRQQASHGFGIFTLDATRSPASGCSDTSGPGGAGESTAMARLAS